MKIVHLCVCGEFYEEYAYQDNLLPKYHRKAGHEVTIIASTYSRFDQNTGKVLRDKCKEKYLADGTKVIRLKPALPLVLNRHIHLFRGLKKAVYKESPDLIFAHGVDCPNYTFLSNYKKKHRKVKIVYDNHGDNNNSGKNAISYYYSRFIVKNLVVKKLINTSDYFYGVAPARCDYLRDMYGVPNEKIHLLPMGADDDKMQFEHRKELRIAVREEYGISKDTFLVVTGGKIDQKKNIHELVKAINLINNPELRILVFGSIVNEMKPVFEELKSEHFIYVGWIPSDDVYRFFYAADLVAFPGLHSVMWEQSVATGVPTAFNEINGFKHVDIGGNCIFFKNNTADYYKRVIEDLISDNDKYEKLLKNASSERTKVFLYSSIADKVLKDIKI